MNFVSYKFDLDLIFLNRGLFCLAVYTQKVLIFNDILCLYIMTVDIIHDDINQAEYSLEKNKH